MEADTRYWITLHSIWERITKTAAEMNQVLRLLFLTLGLAILVQNPSAGKLPHFGPYEFDQAFVNLMSRDVLWFVILEIGHYSLLYFSLQILHFYKWNELKKYKGALPDFYQESNDLTEKVFKTPVFGVVFL